MNKLIKVAERLYKQIDELQGKLAFSLSNDDNETLIKAKCFISNIIDRKDNIVDLGEVWHKYNPKQEICDAIIACYKDDILFEVHSQYSIDIFLKYNRHLEGKVYFSFVKDLLPKGGE